MINSKIIKSALRDLGVLPLGREPSMQQATDALEVLEQIVRYQADNIGQPWIDQDVTGDVAAEENDRLRVNTTDPVVIYLPLSIAPRTRIIECCGNITIEHTCDTDRAPKDRARVSIADVFGTIIPVIYIYRLDIAQWIKATNMTLEQEAPYSDSAFLAAALTIRLSASYGADVPAAILDTARRGLWSAAFTNASSPAEYF